MRSCPSKGRVDRESGVRRLAREATTAGIGVRLHVCVIQIKCVAEPCRNDADRIPLPPCEGLLLCRGVNPDHATLIRRAAKLIRDLLSPVEVRITKLDPADVDTSGTLVATQC